jgi:uncharacterized protein (TIGR02145 family)
MMHRQIFLQISRVSVFSIVVILLSGCEKEDGSIMDIEGNVYKTVTIGDQVWMAENLKTKRYQNGDLLETTDPPDLSLIKIVSPKFQWAYNGDDSKVDNYGRLYTWYAITDTRNICPEGWHVPGDEDWQNLIKVLGGQSVAGGKMKEKGTTHWKYPNVGATNQSGFTALPGGYRTIESFAFMTEIGFYWSSTANDDNGLAYFMQNEAFLGQYGNPYALQPSYFRKAYGMSVRCVKNY